MVNFTTDDATQGGRLAKPKGWSNGAEAFDVRYYSSAELQISGLSGGDTITVSRSLDGTNFITQTWIASDFSSGSTISANGLYTFSAGGFLKWSKTGSASTPAVTIRAEA